MSKLKLEYSRGDVLAEKYEVLDLLDRNPLGPSYRVKHLSSGKYVRLTLLDPNVAGRDRKDDIIAAYKAARAFRHRNLLKVGELRDHRGVAYVTMEDFEGRSLRELMQERKAEGKPFTLKEAAQVCIQVLEACRALHEKGHVFRALRPEYVQVDLRHTGPRGQNVVADVRVAGGGLWDLVPNGSLAEDEFTRGEAQYLAPELKGVDPKPDERNDVYSVGVMFYELLTGATPQGTFQLPSSRRPGLPAHVDNVCELALAMAPEDRYPTARDFAANVKRTFANPLEEEEVKRPGVQPLVMAGGLALVAAVAVMLFQGQTDPYELAVSEDAAQRKAIYDAHPKPSTAEIRAMLDRHPPNMMYIPAGPYVSGKLRQEDNEREAMAEEKELPGFLIDVFEYPNLKGAPPKYDVSYSQAEKLCQDAGKRLCSGPEFEKACKGPMNTVYGYGDTFDEDFCGRGVEDAHAAGALADCKSGWGVFDLAGNLREWTSTPRGENRRIVKGGLPQSPERGTRCAFGTDESRAFADSTISFRCCRDVDAPKWEPPAKDE